jgi:hypothetical protein
MCYTSRYKEVLSIHHLEVTIHTRWFLEWRKFQSRKHTNVVLTMHESKITIKLHQRAVFFFYLCRFQVFIVCSFFLKRCRVLRYRVSGFRVRGLHV